MAQSQLAYMRIEKGSKVFYTGHINVRNIVVEAKKFLRLAAASPALIFPSERQTQERSSYYNALIGKIRDGFPTQYMTHLPSMNHIFDDLSIKDRKTAIQEYEALLGIENLDLRIAPEAFTSCAINEGYTLVLLKSPNARRSMVFRTAKNPHYLEVFDDMFAISMGKREDHERILKQWKSDT